MAVIACDFDGVLHDPDNRQAGYRMGQPVAGAVQATKQLQAQGHTLIVYTVRADPLHVKKWLRYFDIPFSQVTNIKPKADIYLDDRALRFEDWPQALADISRLLADRSEQSKST